MDEDQFLESVKNGSGFLLNTCSIFMELSACFVVQKSVIDNKFNVML
jgi:hypothetical protein